MDVCMLVTNDVRRDPRVQKEARTLAHAGYDVGVVGVTAGAASDWQPAPGGYRIKRIPWDSPVKEGVKSWIAKRAPRSYERMRARIATARGVSEPCRGARARLLAELDSHPARTRRLAFAAIRARPKAIHAHDLDTLQAAAIAARITGAALIYDAHELWWQRHAEGEAPERWIAHFRAVERELIGRADRVITICDSIADFFRETYGIPRPAVVRNATEPPPGGFRDPALLHESGRPLEVLFHGGFHPGRGIEALVRAARKFEGARLVLRGFGALEAELSRMIEREGLSDVVTIEQPVPIEEVVEAASRADIGVIPYQPVCLNNRFSAPNKLFEYLAAGVAVAASDLPEIRRIVHGEEIGALFDPWSAESIASTVNRLAGDPGALVDMRRRAVRAAAERHNWRVEGARLVEVYRRLIS